MFLLLLVLILSVEINGFLASDWKSFTSKIKRSVVPPFHSVNRRPHRFSSLSDGWSSRRSRWTALEPSSLSEDCDDDGESYIPDTSQEVLQFIHRLVSTGECEGIESTTIGFRRADRRRGVFAKESFEPGEYIFAIPFTSTLLVHETFSGQDELSDIQLGLRFWTTFLQPDAPGPQDEQLKDRWSTYLNSLPRQNSSHFTPTPEFWSDDAIDAVEVPTFVQEMKRRQQEANFTISNKFPSVSSDMHQKLCNDLLFASWLVRSRGFTTVKASNQCRSDNKDAGARTRTVLIPYMDFINHESTDAFVNAEIEVVESKTDEESFFALVCRRPIPVGGEILIQYGTGQETALDFVSKYGFYTTDYNNIYDELFVFDSNDGTNTWTSSIEKDEQMLRTQVLSDDMRSAVNLRLNLKRIKR